MRRLWLTIGLLVPALCASLASASAQDYPNRPFAWSCPMRRAAA